MAKEVGEALGKWYLCLFEENLLNQMGGDNCSKCSGKEELNKIASEPNLINSSNLLPPRPSSFPIYYAICSSQEGLYKLGSDVSPSLYLPKEFNDLCNLLAEELRKHITVKEDKYIFFKEKYTRKLRGMHVNETYK